MTAESAPPPTLSPQSPEPTTRSFHPIRALRDWWADRGSWGPYVPERGRDLRIDLLRGFAVVAMVVDHIAGASPLYALTGGNRFYTSAAEGFIFISGLVMGLVYHRFIDRDGLGGSLRRVIERAFTLYLLTITLSLVVIPLSELLSAHWAQGLDFSDPVAFVVSILALHRTYYLVDIPLLYSLLILISPLAIVLLSQGRTAVVLAVSWLLWIAYQLFPTETEVPWPILGNYLFFLSAWQIFFFTGLVLGWHHEQLTVRLASFPRRPALVVLTVASALLIGAFWITGRLAIFWPSDPMTVQEVQLFLVDVLFGKADVRPGRLVASIVIFGFLYLLVTEVWKPIYRALGWFLMPLGQSALYAYASHVIIALPLSLALDNLEIPESIRWQMNAVIQIAVLLLIWAMIRGRVFFVNPTRGKARYLLPAGALVGALLILPLDPSPSAPGLASAAPETDPFASRVARAFGTPVPGKVPPGETVVVLPTPRPSLRRVELPAIGPEARASRYVGELAGTFRNMRFYSPALQKEMQYFIYLPPGYDRDQRSYPVLFMLHGNSGTFEEWPGYGLVGATDQLIDAREILPMIVVMPQGDFSYWVNQADAPPEKYGDYTTMDLVRHIRATYRVLPGKEHMAIGGLSMGAFGALAAGFSHPDTFGIVGAHSPALPTEGEKDFLGTGQDYAERDPFHLARRLIPSEAPNIWIDIGDEDQWLDRTEDLHALLDRRGIPNEFTVAPGEHWGGYWMEHVVDYLRFYDRAFNPHRRA